MNTKEKAVLRQVPQGVIATVNERPKIGQKYYDVKNKTILTFVTSDLDNYLIDQDCHTIIASNFGVGKELFGQYIGYEVFNPNVFLEFDKLHEYTENTNQVIIKL